MDEIDISELEVTNRTQEEVIKRLKSSLQDETNAKIQAQKQLESVCYSVVVVVGLDPVG